MPIDALSVLCAQLTRDLLAITKFLLIFSFITSDEKGDTCFCPFSFVCLSVSKITQKLVHGLG